MNTPDLTDELTEKWSAALRTDHPVLSLREEVKLLRENGTSLQDLEQLLIKFLAEVNEPDDDTVRDVIDFVTGWCSPHMRIV